jgi:DNA-binding PadR family transcriptional regulator
MNDQPEVWQGTVALMVLKTLERAGLSESNRKAKYYESTRAGRKQIQKETQEWDK